MRSRFRAWPRAAAGLVLGLLIGCGPGPDTDRPVRVRVAVWKANNPQAWEDALAAFHAAHPGIHVELEVGPNSSTQLHDLITQKLRNRDTSLDAFLMDVVWPPEFAAAGWTLPLEDRFPPEERTRFFPGCIRAVTYWDELHGVPFNTDGGLLYYRRDLLAEHGLEPPVTWPDLVAQVQTIRAAAGPALQGYSAQFKQYEGLVCNVLEFVRGNGGDLLHPASPASIEALTFVQHQLLAAAPRGILTYEEQESLDLFKSGGAIFLRSWPYAWLILEDEQQSAVAGRVGIAPLPTFPGGHPTAALGGWSFGIHRYSRVPEEAFAFVRFMTGPEMQRHFAVAAGKAPARRALYDDPEVLAANPHFASLRPVFESATPRPRSPIYPRISHVLQRYLHDALSQPEADIASLMRAAEQRIEEELARLPEAARSGTPDPPAP